MDFSVVQDAIKSIAKDYPATARWMQGYLDRGVDVSCKADGEAKAKLFKEIDEALGAAKEQMPDKAKEIQDIEDFYDGTVTVTCSGG